jgi:hypothetical protein
MTAVSALVRARPRATTVGQPSRVCFPFLGVYQSGLRPYGSFSGGLYALAGFALMSAIVSALGATHPNSRGPTRYCGSSG